MSLAGSFRTRPLTSLPAMCECVTSERESLVSAYYVENWSRIAIVAALGGAK